MVRHFSSEKEICLDAGTEQLEALLAGQSDPVTLADLARERLKAKREQLEEALVGTVKPHHRFMLSEELILIDTLDEVIERLS